MFRKFNGLLTCAFSLCFVFTANASEGLSNSEVSNYARDATEIVYSTMYTDLGDVYHRYLDKAEECRPDADEVDGVLQRSLFAESIRIIARPDQVSSADRQALERFVRENDFRRYMDDDPEIRPVEAGVALTYTMRDYSAIICNDQRRENIRKQIQGQMQNRK